MSARAATSTFPESTVFVVDDDPSVRRALARLLRSVGWHSKELGSARELLAQTLPEHPCSLVLDVRMPGLDGLELQEELRKRAWKIPIVFITGHGDVPMSVQAMKKGAVDFLQKPFDDEELIAALERALAWSAEQLEHSAELDELQLRAGTLTPRENEVFALVVRGLLNKQIGGRLGASEKTIKVHRARVMSKMKASSLAELVLFAQKLGVVETPQVTGPRSLESET